MAASIIAIGNPGAGKSTMLNALAAEHLFRSGVSFGKGLTSQLDKRTNNQGVFYDTPGLADETYREAAAKAIRDALREGGPYKLLFFVSQDAGRVVRQDVTTMKLVLKAAPEIGNKYGIVINQVPKEIATLLQVEANKEAFITKLFTGIDNDRKCATTSIMTVMRLDKLVAKDDMVINVRELQSSSGVLFADFVYNEVPTVNLTPERADDIAANEFDAAEEEINGLHQKLENDKEMFKAMQKMLMTQLDNVNKEKEAMRKADSDRWEGQMSLLKDELEKARAFHEQTMKYHAEERKRSQKRGLLRWLF